MMRTHNKVGWPLQWRWRDWVKLGLSAGIEQTGVGAVTRALRTFASGARIHVIGYHRVVDRIVDDGPINPSLCITADSFRRQMEQLRSRFVVLPLSYVVRALSGELELSHDAAAVEALIRVASAADLARLVDALEARLGPPELDAGSAVLCPTEVRALADMGWEIGAHTEGHVVLTHEPLPEVRRQLADSKAELERWSGRPCRYFAYCNGYHSAELVDELRRAGYEGAVTTCDRPNHPGKQHGGDPFRISRKVLWEAHTRGPRGQFSPPLSAAHLHDLFGALGLTRPVDGAMLQYGVSPDNIVQPHNDAADNIVQLHNDSAAPTTSGGDDDSSLNDRPPTEVELAY